MVVFFILVSLCDCVFLWSFFILLSGLQLILEFIDSFCDFVYVFSHLSLVSVELYICSASYC